MDGGGSDLHRPDPATVLVRFPCFPMLNKIVGSDKTTRRHDQDRVAICTVYAALPGLRRHFLVQKNTENCCVIGSFPFYIHGRQAIIHFLLTPPFIDLYFFLFFTKFFHHHTFTSQNHLTIIAKKEFIYHIFRENSDARKIKQRKTYVKS